jgi:hypothetical protein
MSELRVAGLRIAQQLLANERVRVLSDEAAIGMDRRAAAIGLRGGVREYSAKCEDLRLLDARARRFAFGSGIRRTSGDKTCGQTDGSDGDPLGIHVALLLSAVTNCNSQNWQLANLATVACKGGFF